MSFFIDSNNYLLNAINYSVFIKERKRLQLQTDNLIDRHIKGGGTKRRVRMGAHFLSSNAQEKGSESIIPELQDELHNLLCRINKLQSDQQYVRQTSSFLVPPTKDCEEKQHYRDVLSEFLAVNLGFTQICPKRTKEPWYSIADKPSLLRAWKKSEDILAIYLANNLLVD